MFKRFFKCALFTCAAIFATKTQAQVDPHFSQTYVYPQSLNPALTGIIDGDYRVAGIYRSQWANIDGGFKTIGLAAEMVTEKNINLGVGLFQQSAGNGGYKYFTPYASVAYTGIKFGKEGNHHISIGINAGVIDRRFDQSKFEMGDKWNPVTGKPDLPTTDKFDNLSQTAFDMSAGALYFDATPNQKANIFAGFSAGHLTQPKDKFFTNSDSKVPFKYTIHGGVKVNLSETVSLTPNALYMHQGTAEELMLGAYTQIKAGEGFDFLLGANYRLKDAFAAFTGFYYKQFVLGLSYDINTSDLSKIAGSANAFEISLSFTGKKRPHAVEQPFICPRL
jgi:type IX secretion system PorP/SprF family membrane protein